LLLGTSWSGFLLLLCLLLEHTQELLLFLDGLESSMTELAGSVDELELDLLQGRATGLRDKGLTESEDSLLDTDTTTLDDDEVLLDLSVVREATQGVDGLLGKISLGRAGVLGASLSDAVDLLVDLGSVVVTVLTSTGHSEGDSARMPSSNTSDLTETLVCLSWQASGTPTGGHTLVTVTLGDTNDVDVLALVEKSVDLDFLLEEAFGIGNLIGDGATVDLDLHEVSLLLTMLELSNLGVSQDTNDSGVLLDASQLPFQDLGVALDGLLVLGEGLLLGSEPVLVESTKNVLAQVVSPSGGERAQSLRGLDVTNNTNNDNWGSFQNGHSLHNFLLVHL